MIINSTIQVYGKTSHNIFTAKNLRNIRFGETNAYPAVGAQLTTNTYVDEIIDEPSLVKLSGKTRSLTTVL